MARQGLNLPNKAPPFNHRQKKLCVGCNHSKQDDNHSSVKSESTQAIIDALKEQWANAEITELDGATHFDVPSLAYKNDDLIK